MMAAPCSNADKPMASTSWWELHQDPAPRTGLPAGPSLPTSRVNCEPGRGGKIDSDIFSSAELREVHGGPEETWNDTIAAADWLDATHAMLGAICDDGPAQ
ncbi:unnamed protein product [Ectocarpus sp. CCAP 1310/34]|nr:unnamed protein product [Ectocarpus sp. CCAP 1310/34]